MLSVAYPSAAGLAAQNQTQSHTNAEPATRSAHVPAIALDNNALAAGLLDILNRKQLSAVFQPIVDLKSGELLGYEGLIRGPQDSPFHSPFNLFKAARDHGQTSRLEGLCREVILARFAALRLPGRIFINISPECLIEAASDLSGKLNFLHRLQLSPHRIILELTENQATVDYQLMRDVLQRCRELGFQIAIDDLGEGFSSLRLWSEIKPDFVKVDMHFIQGIDRDPVKLQFVQSIQQIAGKSGTVTIAEGIETDSELQTVQEIGVRLGQGYHIARPVAEPGAEIDAELAERIRSRAASAQTSGARRFNLPTALKLLRIVPVVSPNTPTNSVYDIFVRDAKLEVIPVVHNGTPLGTISRTQLTDRLARPYQRELYGAKSCTHFMTPNPLVVDKHTSLQDLSLMIVDGDIQQLTSGFAITDCGHYIGMGTSQDVMREITQMQITAARYANPLTQLPGNVPINEEIDRLVLLGREFVVCYGDIDHFKPFNDVYGYRRGDDLIQMTANLLTAHSEDGVDFVGHIGGDDFIILFQSPDWEARCDRILDAFAQAVAGFYSEEDRARGGYVSEDRRGNQVFHPLASLSLGAVKVDNAHRYSSYQISSAATEAKRQAKAVAGNALFIERRGIR